MVPTAPRGFPYRAGAALVALSFLTAEYMSGNVPFPRILFPPVVLFLILGYGFPVLLIREAIVRWRLGGPGMLLLGGAYGLVNEGLLAKTLTLKTGVPIGLFDGMALAFGIHVPWALFILAYHLCASVALPLLAVRVLFPAEADRPWLSPRAIWAVSALTLLFCSAVYFLGKDPHPPGKPAHFAFYLAAISALLVASHRLARAREHRAANSTGGLLSATETPAPGSNVLRTFLSGTLAAVLVFPATLIFLTKARPTAILFSGVFMAVFSLAVAWLARLSRRDPLKARLSFALGITIPFCALRVIAGFQRGRAIEGAVAALLFLAGTIFLLRRVQRAASAQTTDR